MDTFIVRVCHGEIVNVKKGTRRDGYWVPLNYIPSDIASKLNCQKVTARPYLAWDTKARQWRDLRRAKVNNYTYATAVLAKLDDGTTGIALLDF